MLPVTSASHDGLSAPAWQTWTLVAIYVVAFVIPAVGVALRAARDGEDWHPWFFLTLLASLLGVMEYRKHVRIVAKRRAEAPDAADETGTS